MDQPQGSTTPQDPQPTSDAVPPASAAPPVPPVSQPVPPASPPPPVAPAPTPASGWVMPASAAGRAARSGLAAFAGVVLLVLGVLGTLLGLLIVLGGAVLGTLGQDNRFPGLEGFDFAGAVGGFVAIIGVVVIVYSLLYVAGGIGVLSSREWGRFLGIVVSIISGLFWLAAVASPGDHSSVAFAATLLVAHAYVVVALAFRWRAT